MTASSSSSCCDSSTSSTSSSFSVSFAPYASVYDTIHLRDYSPSEKASCWYNKLEKQLIKMEVKRTKMLISLHQGNGNANIDSDIICTLGLERKRKQQRVVTEQNNIDDDDSDSDDDDDDDDEMLEVRLDDDDEDDDGDDDDKENTTPYHQQQKQHLPKMIVTEI